MKKILIVEDEPNIRELLNIRLRRAGYDTAFAGDGISAISVARRERPDLVILDLGLPGGEGWTVMERMRAIASLGWVPTIVASARTQDVNERRALDAGAVAYVQKPLDMNALLAAVRKALGEDGAA